MMHDPVDASDLNRLAVQVFRQAVEDYLHLQHPVTRTKKYVHEAFLESVDMFWDPDYRMKPFKDEEGNDMDLETFLKLASDRENLDVESFLRYLQTESEKYWKEKHVNTISIPDIMMICNTPYDIRHVDTDTFTIDYDNRIVYLDRRPSETNNMRFCAAVLEIICFHQDLRVSKVAQKELANKFYDALKMNNSFRDAKPPKPSRQEPPQDHLHCESS